MPILQFLILLLLQIGRTENKSWMISKEVKATSPLMNLIAINSHTLIVQTKNSIYKANPQDPNIKEQPIVSASLQSVDISRGSNNDSFLYTISDYIHYEESNSLKQIVVDEIGSLSCLVKIEELIYFYNPQVSPNLSVYNTTSQSISQGPYLMRTKSTQLSMAIEINVQLHHLIISIQSSIFFIDLKTMKLINQFSFDVERKKLEIVVSQQGKYVVLESNNLKTVFRYDKRIDNYTLIYQLVFDGDHYNKFGFTFNEQLNYCYQIMVDKFLDSVVKHITELDCSEPYDKVLDKLESVSQTARFVGGQNMEIIYSLSKKGWNVTLQKHLITQDGFMLQQTHIIPLEVQVNINSILAISQKDILVLINEKQKMIIWSLHDSQCKCKQQIQQNPIFENSIKSAIFDPTQTQLLVFFQYLQSTLLWVDLSNCEIKTKTYQHKIYEIHFMNGGMYIVQTQTMSIYLLDPTSKQLQRRYPISSTSNIVFVGYLLGVHIELYRSFIVRYDAQFSIVKKVQINCQMNYIFLKTGTNHISVICFNQYNIFNFDLEYLGSFSVNTFITPSLDIAETYSPFLRVQFYSGELHKNSFKKWNFVVEPLGSLVIPQSNFYFYNESDVFSLGKDQQKYFLSHHQYYQKKLIAILKVNLQLKVKDIFMTSPSLRWSCDKKYILLKYYSLVDKINIYINVYESFTFRLVYSYRLNIYQAMNIIAEDAFNAYLDCENILTISALSRTYFVNITTAHTILLDEFQDITYASFSSDTQNIVVFGVDYKNSIRIQIRQLLNPQIIKYTDTPYEIKSKVFYLKQQLYILSQDNLYIHTQGKSKLVMTLIADCAYLASDRLICLALNNSLIVVNVISFHSCSLISIGDISYTNILVNKETIVVYNAQELAVYNSVQPFQLLQSVNLQNYRFNLITISPDSNTMITYDHSARIITYWNRSSCPVLTQLVNGECKCKGEIAQGVCRSKVGSFELEGMCSECSFYCKQCKQSKGNCLSISIAGIIMIIGLAMIPVLLGVAICRCIRKHRMMSKNAEVMSELLEERSSIND